MNQVTYLEVSTVELFVVELARAISKKKLLQ